MLRLKRIDVLFLRAERTIALLERCRAVNHVAELERVQRAWCAGRRVEPRFEYAPAPELGELRAALEATVRRCETTGPWGALYAERAAELDREARIVEALGTERFRARAAERFPSDAEPFAAQAEARARRWASAAAERAGKGLALRSDDEQNPHSLVSAMRRAVGSLRLPFRVVLTRSLASAAATGEGVILVRAGVRHAPTAVTRIVVHEVEGHALPRQRAAAEFCGLFAAGSAGGSDDEEGRALLLERRAGCFDAARRAELGQRHLAALSVRQGATWCETAALLLGLGARLADATEIASRAHRGGGLARELIYLPALLRVEAALSGDPALEDWLRRGRLSVAAARKLRELGEPPEWLRPSRAA